MGPYRCMSFNHHMGMNLNIILQNNVWSYNSIGANANISCELGTFSNQGCWVNLTRHDATTFSKIILFICDHCCFDRLCDHFTIDLCEPLKTPNWPSPVDFYDL